MQYSMPNSNARLANHVRYAVNCALQYTSSQSHFSLPRRTHRKARLVLLLEDWEWREFLVIFFGGLAALAVVTPHREDCLE